MRQSRLPSVPPLAPSRSAAHVNLFIQFNAWQSAEAHKSMLQNMQRLHSTPRRSASLLLTMLHGMHKVFKRRQPLGGGAQNHPAQPASPARVTAASRCTN